MHVQTQIVYIKYVQIFVYQWEDREKREEEKRRNREERKQGWKK